MAENIDIVPGEAVESGDIVVPMKFYQPSLDARGRYETAVAGVISDSAQFIIGSSRDANGNSRAPFGLSGLVRVKVTSENGSIKVGDYLVTAETPGRAMPTIPKPIALPRLSAWHSNLGKKERGE